MKLYLKPPLLELLAVYLLTSLVSCEKPTIPDVSTAQVTSITQTGAISGGNVKNNGGEEVTSRGVCWSTTQEPSVNSEKTSDGTGNGSFISNIDDLIANTTYYVCAYAINSEGIGYGKIVQFATKSPLLPTLTTTAISSVTDTTAVSGGNITDDGGSAITARGVCWNTTPDPTISNNKTLDGEGKGIFVSKISGLSANTTYYVRAYARNSEGIGYGNEVSFETQKVPPEANFTASPTTITEGQSVQFTDQSKNNPTSWSWSFGDDSTGTLQSPSHIYATAGTYTVILTVTNSAGSDTETKTGYITVSVGVVKPVAAFTASPTTIATGQNVQFTDQSKNNPTSWSWNFGDEGTSTSQNPSHTYTTPGTYTVSLTSTNSAGSDAETKTNFIVVVAPPEANFTASPTSITAGQSVQFTDQSKNNPTSWSWNFGDGGTSTSQNPSHTYTTLGTYTVSLTSTNSAGSDTETKTNFIVIGAPPVTAFTASPTTITAGQSVQFTDQSTNNPTSWSWNFGDGGTSTSKSPSHTYVTPGKYTVILTVTNGSGSDTETKSDLINVNPVPIAPIAYFSASTRIVTVGESVQFTDNSANIPTSWSWDFGNGVTSTLKNPSHIYSLAGTYTVTLIVTNSAGSDTELKSNYIKVVLCPTTLTVTHSAGLVAPVTKTVTYGIAETVLSGANKCWITSNLGADNQAGSSTDATDAAAGWYWQFNKKRGYKHDGTTRTPSSTWISSINEVSNWIAANDPCAILLGTGWRIPTSTEWTNFDNNDGWNNYNDTYASVIKLHAAGRLDSRNGSLDYRGSHGIFWSSTQFSDTPGWYLVITSGVSYIENGSKSFGFSIRCIKD